MAYQPIQPAEQTAFVTGATLAAGATFDSGVLDANGYSQVQTEINASHNGQIDIDFCSDPAGAVVIRSISIPYTAANGYQFFAAPAFGNYIRYKFDNTSGSPQTDFYYTTKWLTTAISPQLLTTDAFIAPAMVTQLGRSITVGQNPSGTLVNEKVEGVSFVTGATLAIGGTYSTDILDARGYQQVSTSIVSDVDGTATFEFLSGSTGPVVRTLNISYAASTGYQLLSAPAFTDYVRYSYTNGATAQGNFHYETKFLTGALSGQVLPLNSPVFGGMVANLGANVIIGKNDSGSYNQVKLDNENHLAVNATNPKSSYDELPIAELSPISQLSFPYNINEDLVTVTTLNGGTATQDQNMACVGTGTLITGASGQSAKIESKDTITFRPGQGAMARFSALFTNHGPNGDTAIQGIGIGDETDGYGFAYTGATFGISYRTGGTQTNIPQSSWNIDKMDGTGNSGMTLDQTKGNVYQISYGSGFGCINFSLESQSTGDMVLVHILHLANQKTIPSAFNPTFPLRAEVFKDGAAGATDPNNYEVKVSDMSSFIEGLNKITGPVNGFTNSKLSAGITVVTLFTLYNKAIFATKVNKVSSLMKSISIANASAESGNITVIENGVLIGAAVTPTDISTATSVMATDIAATVVTGGRVVWVGSVSKDGGTSVDLSSLGIRMLPGSHYTITSALTAADPKVMSASIVWQEDF